MSDSPLQQMTKQALIARIESLEQQLAVQQRSFADALEMSEARFSLLVDNSPIGIYMTDHQFRIVYANRQLADTFGYTVEELKAMDFRNFIAQDDLDRLIDSYQRRRRGENVPSEFEFIGTRKDGTPRHLVVYVSTIQFPDGNIRSWGQVLDVTDQRQAQEALAKERNLLRTVIDILPDNIFVKDIEGHFLLNNAVSMAILGVERQEDLYGKTDYDFLSPEFAEQARADELVVLESGVPILNREVFQAEEANNWRWLVFSTIPLRNAQGEITGLVGMTHDISERKRSEEVLTRLNRAYQVLSECNEAVVHSRDEAVLVADVCRILVEIGGYRMAWVGYVRPDDMLSVQPVAKAGAGTTYVDLVENSGDDAFGQGPTTLAVRSRQTVIIQDIETDLRIARWKTTALEYGFRSAISLPLVGDGRVLGNLNIYADEQNAFSLAESGLLEQMVGNLAFGIVSLRAQTERSRMEQDLRERESLLSAIVNSQIDLICRYTPDTVLTFVNDAYCAYVNQPREALIGKSYLPLVPPSEHESILARIDEAVRFHVPAVYDRRMILSDDSIHWVQWVDQTVVDHHGQILIQAVGRDITAQKQAESALLDMNKKLEQRVIERTADLQAANERLEALSRIKDEFVSNVSHELRTPITSLTIREHLLRRNPERLDYHLEVMERETDRLRRTIEDLLQLSRLDQKQTQLALNPVDINTVVKRYVSDRSPIAEARSLSMAFDESPDLPGVPADEGLLEQTLGILITNAMNYTPAGGLITVRTAAQHGGDGGWVGFSVSDNGPGIPPQDQPRLFERFFRGEAGRASGAAGTGLGLAIAKEIVDRHSGKIEVESSGVKGEGARFTVWLPQDRAYAQGQV